MQHTLMPYIKYFKGSVVLLSLTLGNNYNINAMQHALIPYIKESVVLSSLVPRNNYNINATCIDAIYKI